MDQDKLAEIIVEAREKLGMNQGEASLHCAFSETYLGMIERKRRIPGPRALLRIMTRLGIKEEAMREFLPPEFHNLYEASDPEYPRIREYLQTHTSSEGLKKELVGTSFSSIEGFICEFLFDYWDSALINDIIPREDWRYSLVRVMVDEVKNAESSRTFIRMLEMFEDEEQGPDGRTFSMLSLLKEWFYDKEKNEVILKISLDDKHGVERIYRLKPGDRREGRGRAASSREEIEQVRRQAMEDSGFYELSRGLRELIYDERTFQEFRVKEEELKYLKQVELRGTGGEPTKEGYLFELERLRRGQYPSTDDSLLLLKEKNPQLFELVNKIMVSDEDTRERVLKAIGPAVDVIIDAAT